VKTLSYKRFSSYLDKGFTSRRPLYGQLELTCRCNYNCIHCYCNGTGSSNEELNFSQWKDIIEQIYSLGGLYLTLTGGEPILHRDFLKIYTYARNKGFLITVFSNGYGLDEKLINYFEEAPPFNIEVTLNGITASVYENITQVKDSFKKAMANIRSIKGKKLPLTLKTNGLKENKDEILKIKKFVYDFLGKGKYKFDPFIMPSLTGLLEPTRHRLKPSEILELESKDPDMLAQRKKEAAHARNFKRDKSYLYRCNAWWTNYFINPYGLLQFCHLSKKYSTDLTKIPFKYGFYEKFPKLLKEKYKTKSKCILCKYRDYCYRCPARVSLETGNEEAPVPYFCELAKKTYKQKAALRRVENNA